MPIIPALGRWRQEDQEFEASVGYTVRPCLRKPKAGDVLRGRALAWHVHSPGFDPQHHKKEKKEREVES
jgi:hypothetical protein